MTSMTPLKAHVRNGRLVLDSATDLPDGTEVCLVPADWWDDHDDESRRRLEESLARSESDVQEGRLFPAEFIYTVHPIRREVVVRAVWHAARGEAPELR